MLRIVNDILSALDNDNISVLLLLDLSAAFDTIDHQILLSRLNSVFGIQSTALQWGATSAGMDVGVFLGVSCHFFIYFLRGLKGGGGGVVFVVVCCRFVPYWKLAGLLAQIRITQH